MFGFSNTTKIIFTIAVILFACGSFYFSFRGSKFLKSLKSKLTMAVVVVAVVLITTLSLISVRFVERSSIETLANTIKPIAESTAGNFDQTVNRLGESLSESIHNSSGSKNVDDVLSSLKNNFPTIVKERFNVSISDYCSYYVFDSSGKVLSHFGDTSLDINSIVTSSDVSEAITVGRPVITKCVNSENMSSFAVLSAVNDPQDPSKKDVVGVALNGYALSNILEKNSLSKMGEFYIVDSDGKIIIHPTSSSSMFKYENPIEKAKDNKDYKDVASAFEKVNDSDDGYVTFKYDGKEYVGGYFKVATFNAKILMVTDSSEYTKTAMMALESIFFVGIILLCVVMICATLFARRISKPIVSATDRIRGLAQGNLTDPVDVWYSNDELGVLSNSLDETVLSLRQYINIITVALTKISEGDLCHKMEGTFKGDFYKIKSTFNEILSALSDTFAAINMSAEQVNSGATQVSDSAQALSQGSTQQASAIEELSATLTDVSKQTQQNSMDAKNAYNIVMDNTEAINNCNDDMTNMLKAMNEISDASAEIAKIIKVIDEISFQTNILALNAAVEAAREGSKGFGVVADEVRRLASRSAEAAKQTAQLIENSAIAVNKGSKIAEDTAESLEQIVRRSEEITTLMRNITEASEAQADAIVQIDTGVDQISAVVSKNTSTAVGFASASEELSSQSLILKNMIARFRLSEEDAESAPAAVKENIDPFDLLDAQESTAPAAEEKASHTELSKEDMEILGFTSDDDDKY